jgi:hypothetical protein
VKWVSCRNIKYFVAHFRYNFKYLKARQRAAVQRKCNNSEDAPISPSFRIAHIAKIQLYGCTAFVLNI